MTVRLYQKKNPKQCWVPKCKNNGEPFVLTFDNAEADVILCEKHGEEAQEAGQ
jgi:hypothetical protein